MKDHIIAQRAGGNAVGRQLSLKPEEVSDDIRLLMDNLKSNK